MPVKKKKKAAKKAGKKAKKKKPGRSPAAKKSSSSMVPYDEVNEIVDFLERRGLEEFEFERGGIRIRLKRQGLSVAAPVAAQPAPAASAQSSGGAAAAEPSPSDLGDDVHIIKSPIVGTFYTAASSDAQPFVQAGDKVKAGQVLCIVEAMKLMNEIESDIAGEIVKVFGENAQPVEYGEPLFAIRPA